VSEQLLFHAKLAICCEKNDFSNGNRSFPFDVDFVVFYLPHLYLSNTALSYQNMNGLSLASI
jgi:hypothetical protein